MEARISMIDQQKLVTRLRERLGLVEADLADCEILKVTDGTFLRAVIELRIAWEELKQNLGKIFPFSLLKRWFR